jgi:hypothetical protein
VLAPFGAVGLGIGLAVLVLGVLGAIALFSVLEGIYKAALYRYATTGQVGGAFQPDQLAAAFTPK